MEKHVGLPVYLKLSITDSRGDITHIHLMQPVKQENGLNWETLQIGSCFCKIAVFFFFSFSYYQSYSEIIITWYSTNLCLILFKHRKSISKKDPKTVYLIRKRFNLKTVLLKRQTKVVLPKLILIFPG